MTSIGELIGTIALDDKFSGPAEKITKGLGLQGESFLSVTKFAGLAAAGITAAAGAIVALGMRGNDVEGVQDSFAGLTARAGESADVMLGALRTGVQGTIADFDLMKLANTALGSGLVSSSRDMETLAAGAKLLSGRTGGDTTEAFKKLTESMAKGNVTGLKTMGVFVDSKSALESYAQGIKKSVGDLTDQERAAALNAAGMSALRREIEAAGPATLSFSDVIDKGKAQVQNFTDALGLAIARSPVVRAGMDTMAAGVEKAFGGSQQEKVQALMGFVNGFAMFLVDAAAVGVESARFISNAWDGLKFGFNTLMDVMVSSIAGVAGILAGVAKNMEAIPGIGDKMSSVTGVMKEIEASANALGASFAEQAQEALDSADASNAAFDGVRAVLDKTTEAMRAASSAQVDLTSSAPAAAAGIGLVGEAAGMTAAQLKAIEDQTRQGIETLLDTAAQARDTYQQLQDELTVMNATGVQARLAELAIARETEMAGIQHLAFMYPEVYEGIAALVTEKYRQMSLAAQGMHASIEQAAAAQGFGTRDELERTALVAQDTYERMRASGLFTEAALLEAKKKAEEAKRRLELETAGLTMTSNEALRAGALQLYGVLSEKFKAVAIAGAVISTYQAVAKSMAAAPWPANLVLAAGALAAGMANVAKIRGAQAGFAEGTPGTSFVDFGRETVIAAHGEEAIVNRAQGATLAEVISGRVDRRLDAMDSASAAEVRMLREEMSAQRRDLPLMLRDAMRLAMA